MTEPRRGSDLLIVDDSDELWKVADYLREWCAIAKRIDIATGNFEIGGLLALGDAWQRVDEIRMTIERAGDESDAPLGETHPGERITAPWPRWALVRQRRESWQQ